MYRSEKNTNRETLERYCHVIGANTPVSRFTRDGKTVYECMNHHKCAQNGGCKNEKFASEPSDAT